MRRTDYKNELSIASTQKRGGNNAKADVKKIQEWLSLHGYLHRNWGTITSVDGDFGPATERAVKNFQYHKRIPRTGVVTQSLFEQLSAPIKNAFETVRKQSSLRSTIVKVAENHLKNYARELYYNHQGNMGPWVRSYMKGFQGGNYAWCAGFVSSVIDQAFHLHGLEANHLAPFTWNCDTLAQYAKNKNAYIPFENYRSTPAIIQPGDIFLIRKNSRDWIHTGMVIQVSGNVFTTIEGNTNEGGSVNGYGVLRRVRNFQQQKLDIFSLRNWARDISKPKLGVLKLHSRGAAVKYLEEELVKKGYHQVIISEYFGVSTDTAVRDFQRKKGLMIDGIVGPNTWSAILQ